MEESTQIETNDAPVAAPKNPARRRFFALGGAVAAGAVLVACGDDDEEPASSGDPSTSSTTAGDSGEEDPADDAAIATFAAGLELLAADTYAAALDAAGKGALGEVPPAVGEFATTAQAHHQAASDALAEAAGGITPEVDPEIKATVDKAFAEVTDVVGLAKLALSLELQAAATYLDVLPKLKSKGAIDLVGSILPIERQHAAILHFALGEYPVPDTFATTDESLAPA